MHRAVTLLLLLAGACVEAPAGDAFTAVVEPEPEPTACDCEADIASAVEAAKAAIVATPTTPPAAEAAGGRSDIELLALAAGIPVEEFIGEDPPAEDPAAGIAAPAAPPAPPAPPDVAPVSTPVPSGFGVRLVATIPDSQPPRAILGMPDGREIVVEPGGFVPDARLVVLAVGRDTVQLAEVKPAGDRAVIQAMTLQSLYPQGASRPAP